MSLMALSTSLITGLRKAGDNECHLDAPVTSRALSELGGVHVPEVGSCVRKRDVPS